MYEILSGALAGRLTLLVSSCFCVTGYMFNMVSLFQYRKKNENREWVLKVHHGVLLVKT